MQNEPPKDIERDKKKEPGEKWAADQKERGYYYDDAHGYEQFDPDSDKETEEDESISDDPSD